MRWNHAHGNEQQFRIDFAECQQQAYGAIGNAPQKPVPLYGPPENPYAGLMAAQQNMWSGYAVAAQRQDFVDNCLVSRGYYKTSQ